MLYLRSEPGRAHHIPFGQRQFVRRIEDAVRETGGGDLIAYDGFENLTGNLRRGRSGFGWATGWESAGRRRGLLAEIVDAPDDFVFGVNRSGRRLLTLHDEGNLRRQFEKQIALLPETSIFVSLIVNRQLVGGDDESSLQIFLEPESASPRYTRRHAISCGITSDGTLFINNAGVIDKIAVSLSMDEPLLLVMKYYISDANQAACNLRVYHQNEQPESRESTTWTIQGRPSSGPFHFKSIRLSSGKGA